LPLTALYRKSARKPLGGFSQGMNGLLALQAVLPRGIISIWIINTSNTSSTASTSFQHKTALKLVQQYDTIYHEDLQTANMLKNHHLAKSIQDAGWQTCLSILAFKAACAGKQVVAVPPASTSQTCSGCGVVAYKGLSVRWHACPDCGASLHRDHNAAKNIERLGQSLRGAVA
jgi:IS605 OrfB family transposase